MTLIDRRKNYFFSSNFFRIKYIPIIRNKKATVEKGVAPISLKNFITALFPGESSAMKLMQIKAQTNEVINISVYPITFVIFLKFLS